MGRQFNGTNQALQAASVDLSGTSIVSASFWFRATEYSATTEVILEFTESSDTNVQSWMVFTDNDIYIKLYVFGNAGYNGCTYTGPTPTDQWRHYVAIFDKTKTGPADEVDLYIDGTLQSGTRGDTSDNTNAFGVNTLNFASRAITTFWRNCSLADVAVWNMRLSGGDITSLAGGTLPSAVQTSNLKGYWKLCGTDSPEPDSSSGAHNATLTGTPTQVAHPTAITGSCGPAPETRTITMVRGG